MNYLHWSTPVLLFCVAIAGGFDHHHAIISNMPSKIFLRVTTWKTFTTTLSNATFVYKLFDWVLSTLTLFWMHENEILVGPKQRRVVTKRCSTQWQNTSFNERFFFRENLRRNQYMFFACHVEVYDHAPNRRYSKIKSLMRSCTPCDLYIQGTRWCTISSSFQEFVEFLSKEQLKSRWGLWNKDWFI